MLTNSQLPTNTVRNPEAFERSMNLPKIAWKTGTSYGHRDAWCIGYSPTLTIGVWLGNFDGKGAPMLSGTDAGNPYPIRALYRLDRTRYTPLVYRAGTTENTPSMCLEWRANFITLSGT